MVVGAPLLASCELPERVVEGPVAVENRCVDEGVERGSCGPEARCAGGFCRALEGAELPVLLAVERSQVGAAGASPPTFVPLGTLASLAALDAAGGALPVALTEPVSTVISVTLPADAAGECKPVSARGCKNRCASDHTIAVQASLRPSNARRGLPVATFSDHARDPFNANPPQTLRVSMQLPLDTYDVTLEPFGDEACPLPPVLLRSRALLEAGTAVLNVPLPTPLALDGTVLADPGFDLGGYRAELIDGRSGQRISTVGTVVATETTGTWRFGALAPDGALVPIEYFLPVVPPGSAQPLAFLRLSPPTGALAPAFAWELAAITVFDASPTLSLADFAPQFVQADGKVDREGSSRGVESRMWLQSIVEGRLSSLASSPPGVPSFFAATSVASDRDGVITQPLLPGEYEQVVFPQGNTSLGIARRRVTVPLVGGGVLDCTVGARPALELGVFAVASDEPVVGVPFRVEPSDVGQPALARVFERVVVPPRPAAGLTEGDGRLVASLDEGVHDVTVRFAPESNLPWLVKPRVPVPQLTSGTLRVTPPIEVRGLAFERRAGSERPLVRGSVRAYVELPAAPSPVDEGALPPTLLVVGEASIDAEGRFRLLLPSRL